MSELENGLRAGYVIHSLLDALTWLKRNGESPGNGRFTVHNVDLVRVDEAAVRLRTIMATLVNQED